jgi:hypothetical protein
MFQVILSACSPVLRSILNPQEFMAPVPSSAPTILYLKGISSAHLSLILDFMYNGEIAIAEEEVAGFLEVAESFQIRGLHTVKQSSNSTSEKRPQQASPPPKRSKMSTPQPKQENGDWIEEDMVEVQMEPIQGTSAGGDGDAEAVGEDVEAVGEDAEAVGEDAEAAAGEDAEAAGEGKPKGGITWQDYKDWQDLQDYEALKEANGDDPDPDTTADGGDSWNTGNEAN